MNEFKVIAVMNEAMLKLLKDKERDYAGNLEIKKNLEDEAFFFKISKMKAYEILHNVGIKEEKVDEVYKKLISKNVFYDLLNKGKIKENDKDMLIKYDKYDANELFKKKI